MLNINRNIQPMPGFSPLDGAFYAHATSSPPRISFLRAEHTSGRFVYHVFVWYRQRAKYHSTVVRKYCEAVEEKIHSN
jgi:hypothetical protein